MTSSVLERETVVPARAPWDLRRRLRQLALAGAVPLMALPAAWYGYQWWTLGRFIESTGDAHVGGDITVIAPRVAGLIAEVAVADNQAVHAGDLLVRLDDHDYRVALDRATAAVAGQQAALANLDAIRHQPAENATGNFVKIVQRVPVRILLDRDAATLGRLRPGLSVTASVDQRDSIGTAR
jgi:membrane fusion protein (multidrug efflux system)